MDPDHALLADATQRELDALRAENAALRAEAARSSAHVRLLLALGRATEERDIDALVGGVLDGIVEALDVDVAMMHFAGEEGLELAALRNARGTESPGSRTLLAAVAIDDQTLSGRAALERRTIVADRTTWPRGSKALVERLAACHAAATPLVVRERLVGTVCVVRRCERPMSALEVRLLEACAAHTSAAIEHARLLDEERRRVRDLSVINELGALVGERLDLSAVLVTGARYLARITDVTHASIALLEGPDRARIVASTAPDPRHTNTLMDLNEPSTVAEVIRLRAPVTIGDAARDPRVSREFQARFGFRSLMGAPLISRGEPIGALLVCDKRARREFTAAEVDRVVAIANHMASAIANARLYEDLKRSYDELSRAQQALVERERLAALGELAAVVAHEVRNPLGVIWNSLGSLRRMLKPSGDVAVLLDILGEESQRLNRIVGDLLDFARPHSPELRPEPIEAVVSGAIDAACAADAPKRIDFSWEAPSPPPSILADARMLRQAFLNLFLNAIQAMPGGGRVAVRAEIEAGEAPRVRVDVSDDGPGIPAEVAAQVFQPFFTTKATGTGLGLAVVKRIVEAHGGEVCVAPRAPEAGTTFTLRLPLAPDPAASQRDPTPKSAKASSR